MKLAQSLDEMVANAREEEAEGESRRLILLGICAGLDFAWHLGADVPQVHSAGVQWLMGEIARERDSVFGSPEHKGGK